MKRINLSNVKTIRPWKGGSLLTKIDGEVTTLTEKDFASDLLQETAQKKGFAYIVNRLVNLSLVSSVKTNVNEASDKYEVVLGIKEGNEEVFNCKTEKEATELKLTVKGLVSAHQNPKGNEITR